MTLNYNLVTDPSGKQSLTVIINGVPETIASTHLNFQKVSDYVQNGGDDENEVKVLVNAREYVPTKLKQLTSRVAFVDGQLTFDGEIIDTALSKHIIRMVREGEDGFIAYVRFMENLSTNPSVIARRQLFTWLKAQDFTLTDDGLIVGYKSVRNDRLSHTSGENTVYVSGEEYTGRVPNPDGARVWIARQEVDPDRDNECSYGLHVGTHSYASTFRSYDGAVVLQVHVNPRDVVAVPRDHDGTKMRVAEYTVVGPIEERLIQAIYRQPVPTFEEVTDEDDLEEEYAEEWQLEGFSSEEDYEDFLNERGDYAPEWEQEGFASEEDYDDYLNDCGDYAPEHEEDFSDEEILERLREDEGDSQQSATPLFDKALEEAKAEVAAPKKHTLRDAWGKFTRKVSGESE